MYFPRKLKQDISIRGFIPALTCISISALAWIFLGMREAMLSVAMFFILYSGFSFWVYIRVRNQSYLAASFFQLFGGIYFATHPRFSVIPTINSIVSGIIISFFLASAIWLLYLFFTKRAKWKGREIFELASMSTEPLPDGFTERPRPSGRADYTKEELYGFAEYLRRNLIAMPYFEENRVVFVPVKMDDSFGYIFNPEKFRQNRSWIALDFQGNVTVNISRIDYLEYKEELSFDQLCDNLGKLFIVFMKYYRKGEAERIVYQLNGLGLGITS